MRAVAVGVQGGDVAGEKVTAVVVVDRRGAIGDAAGIDQVAGVVLEGLLERNGDEEQEGEGDGRVVRS